VNDLKCPPPQWAMEAYKLHLRLCASNVRVREWHLTADQKYDLLEYNGRDDLLFGCPVALRET
jgi:hypothetical protein